MKIDYTFKIDGLFHSVNYYRSETPMNIESMPTATATGITGLSYRDETAEVEKAYYVRFGSVRGDVEKISDEIRVSTSQYLINMPFSVDVNDHGKNLLVSTKVGSPIIQDGYLYVPNGSYLQLNTEGINEFNLGSDDFEFGAEIALMPSGGGSYPSIFAVGSAWGKSGAVSMQYNPSSIFMGAFYESSEIDAFAPSAQARNEAFVKYVVKRVGGVITTYKDGVAGQPVNSSMAVDLSRNGVLTIGAAIWAVDVTRSHCKIKNLYFKKT